MTISSNDLVMLDRRDSNNVGVPTATQIYGTTANKATVTQGTSRTTGVTLNNPVGQITLFSAAGATTPTTFTVTNSFVAADDVVNVSVQSGTDPRAVFVTVTGAGSFNVTTYAITGTTTEAPVINFAVQKSTII